MASKAQFRFEINEKVTFRSVITDINDCILYLSVNYGTHSFPHWHNIVGISRYRSEKLNVHQMKVRLKPNMRSMFLTSLHLGSEERLKVGDWRDGSRTTRCAAIQREA